MVKQLRLCGLAAAVLALAGLAFVAGQGQAGDDEKIYAEVKKIAAAIKKGDKETAEKTAAALAKKVDMTEEVMNVFKPRKKGGLGFGDKPGVVVPDGIWVKIEDMSRNGITVANLKREADLLEEGGYIVLAVAEFAKHRGPTANKGAKTQKAWANYIEDMKVGGHKLIDAAKAKGAAEMKTAAGKANASCTGCHAIFK